MIITIPIIEVGKNTHRMVKNIRELLKEVKDEYPYCSLNYLAVKSGVSLSTIKSWNRGGPARLTSVKRVFDVIKTFDKELVLVAKATDNLQSSDENDHYSDRDMLAMILANQKIILERLDEVKRINRVFDNI
jgi:hypothetical protein